MLHNLDKAEKFAWIDSADEWLSIRMLRNQMVHDYIEDTLILHNALQTGHRFTATLITTAAKMLRAIPKDRTVDDRIKLNWLGTV